MTSKNKKNCFPKSITDEDGYMQITLNTGSYDIETLNDESKKIIIDAGPYTEAKYPFTIKANFSILESIIKISS